MSLTAALNNSISALSVNQAAIAVVSQNVANANNPDYSRKLASQEAVVAGNIRAGVKIGEIRRIINEFLIRDLRQTSTDLGRVDVQLPFVDRLQNFFGTPSSNDTLAGRLDRVFASFENAATIPHSTVARSEIIEAMTDMIREINELATQTQSIRHDVDQQILSEVTTINAALAQIVRLNAQIAVESAGTGDPSELLDLRDGQLKIIAERMPINVFEKSDGEITIFAGTGIALLEDRPRVLAYDPASVVTPQTIFNSIEVFNTDANGNAIGTGAFLEDEIPSGQLRGLLDLRDTALPDLSSGLGEFASRFADEVNRVHNNNTGFPPPNALVGSRNTGFTTTDAHNFTGQATFAVMDANNDISATVTVDFGAIGATIGDVITAVNAGLPGANGATLALTSGVMSFTATAGTDRVGIVQSTTAPSTRAGRGFAHFFGLNDLVSTTTSPFFDYGFTAGETHLFTGTSTFRVLDSDRQTVSTVTFDSGAAGATFGGLATSLTTALSPFATASLNATTGRFELTEASGFTVLASDDATANRAGTGLGLATMLGLGRDKVQQIATTTQVNPTIVATPTLLGIGQLQTTVGNRGITPGDSRGGLALAGVATTGISINAAGNLPAQTLTLTTYAGAVIADTARYAAQTQLQADSLEALFNGLDVKAKSISGVNVDEELANLILLQNAFAASARVISTVNQMFADLLSSVR